MDANEFLNSKGLIYTRELININDERINLIELLNEYKALSQHDVIKNEVAVCVHPFKYIMKEENGMFKCIHCGKELDEQTVL